METNQQPKPELLKIPSTYLDDVCDLIGRSLTGKAMKRFEIIPHRDTLKSNIKELIYEELRQLKEVLYAYNKGYECKVFQFKGKK